MHIRLICLQEGSCQILQRFSLSKLASPPLLVLRSPGLWFSWTSLLNFWFSRTHLFMIPVLILRSFFPLVIWNSGHHALCQMSSNPLVLWSVELWPSWLLSFSWGFWSSGLQVLLPSWLQIIILWCSTQLFLWYSGPLSSSSLVLCMYVLYITLPIYNAQITWNPRVPGASNYRSGPDKF